MPHGDLSDRASAFCAFTGLVSIAYPSAWFIGAGPLKPFFDGAATPTELALIRCIGGLLMFMGPVLFVVRWNTVNGKAGMLGMLIASATFAWTGLSIDGFEFVFRGWYIVALAFLGAAWHLGFNANPMLTSADLLEKEKKKAAKAAAKNA
jgi:hypothetical protein